MWVDIQQKYHLCTHYHDANWYQIACTNRLLTLNTHTNTRVYINNMQTDYTLHHITLTLNHTTHPIPMQTDYTLHHTTLYPYHTLYTLHTTHSISYTTLNTHANSSHIASLTHRRKSAVPLRLPRRIKPIIIRIRILLNQIIRPNPRHWPLIK